MNDTQKAENLEESILNQSLEIKISTFTTNATASITSKRGITDILNRRCQSSQRIRDLLTDKIIQYDLTSKMSISQKRKTLYTQKGRKTRAEPTTTQDLSY